MKKIILGFQLLLLFSGVSAQNNERIMIGEKATLFSKVLNENRRVWVYTPQFTALDTCTTKKYPVLYVLDGDAHFLSTVGIIQQLSQANGNGILPEMIIVGIENTNRLRDLTPSEKTDQNTYKRNPFIDFLSSELVPFIDKNYNTAPYKLLVGHSLGGLTVIDILGNFPKLFDAYIAIDPSIWYKNEFVLNQTITEWPKKNMAGTKLYMGIANTLPKGMTLSLLDKDKSPETQHLRSILKLDKFLKRSSNGLKYASKYYENDTHNSVNLISEYDGLRFIFDYFVLNATEKDFTDSTFNIAIQLKTHYDKVSKEMGYKVSAPEAFINYLSYDAISKKQYAKAKALCQLNIDSYPNSSNCYSAYGDYFIAQGDTINAKNNYKKALQLHQNITLEAKLNALTKQPLTSLSAEELEKYAGIYTLELYKIDIRLKMRENKLWSVVPGQEDSEFVPVATHVFTVKGKQGYTITFEMKGDKPLSFTSVQPNGTFKAVLKHE